TPLGRPDAERVTLPLKPFDGVMLIVLVPWLPCVMVKLLGLADSVKLGAGVTVRLIVVVLFKLPDVPVIVTVAVPVAAVTLAVRVSVLLLVAGLGLNAAVTPLGRPDAKRVTLPLKPFDGVMLIVLVGQFEEDHHDQPDGNPGAELHTVGQSEQLDHHAG